MLSFSTCSTCQAWTTCAKHPFFLHTCAAPAPFDSRSHLDVLSSKKGVRQIAIRVSNIATYYTYNINPSSYHALSAWCSHQHPWTPCSNISATKLSLIIGPYDITDSSAKLSLGCKSIICCSHCLCSYQWLVESGSLPAQLISLTVSMRNLGW